MLCPSDFYGNFLISLIFRTLARPPDSVRYSKGIQLQVNHQSHPSSGEKPAVRECRAGSPEIATDVLKLKSKRDGYFLLAQFDATPRPDFRFVEEFRSLMAINDGSQTVSTDDKWLLKRLWRNSCAPLFQHIIADSNVRFLYGTHATSGLIWPQKKWAFLAAGGLVI